MSNIHSLSLSKGEKKKDEEEFTQSSAGQSSTSVLRPNNGSGRDIDDLLAQARAQSASGSSPAADRNIGQITLYSNGFIIGSGEFRPTSDQKNAKFLAELKKGDVPTELEQQCKQEWGPNVNNVALNLLDKSGEVFVPPKPKFDFAQSKGQSIASSRTTSGDSFNGAVAGRVTVDTSAPTTTLQIVLADRSRVKETLNHSTTVFQLYCHIMALSGRAGFELLSGFPPKPITDPTLTLSQAGLIGASIQQK